MRRLRHNLVVALVVIASTAHPAAAEPGLPIARVLRAISSGTIVTGHFMGHSIGNCFGTERDFVCDFEFTSSVQCTETYANGKVGHVLPCSIRHSTVEAFRTRGTAVLTAPDLAVACTTYGPNPRYEDHVQPVLVVNSPLLGDVDVALSPITYSGTLSGGQGAFVGRHTSTYTMVVQATFTAAFGCSQQDGLLLTGTYTIIP